MLQCLLLSLMECLVAISVWECSGFSLQPVNTAVGWDGMCECWPGAAPAAHGLCSFPAWPSVPECSWEGQARQGSCSSALLLQKGNNALGFSYQDSYSSALPLRCFSADLSINTRTDARIIFLLPVLYFEVSREKCAKECWEWELHWSALDCSILCLVVSGTSQNRGCLRTVLSWGTFPFWELLDTLLQAISFILRLIWAFSYNSRWWGFFFTYEN